jgi:hypothetical protein
MAGKTAREAFQHAAKIAYGIGIYMSDPTLWAMIKRDNELKNEIEGILKNLERVASKREFLDIRNKYGVI